MAGFKRARDDVAGSWRSGYAGLVMILESPNLLRARVCQFTLDHDGNWDTEFPQTRLRVVVASTDYEGRFKYDFFLLH